MSTEELDELKSKLEKIEKEFNQLKEPLKKTLTDIRTIISELENPFNYLRAILGEVPVSSIEEKLIPLEKQEKEEGVLEKKESEEVEEKKKEVLRISEEIKEKVPQDKRRHIAVIVSAWYLVRIFGGVKNALQHIDYYEKCGWVSPATSREVKDAIRLFEGEIETEYSRAGITEQITAIYLLNKLATDYLDSVFLILLLSVIREIPEVSTEILGKELRKCLEG